MLEELYSLIDTDDKFNLFVNDTVRLSFYADFLYPLASESTSDQFYNEIPEGDFSDELSNCRKILWNVLHKYNMKLIRFSPASFIHFGTTRELLSLVTDEIEMYKSLEWSGQINTNTRDKHYAVTNSYISRNSAIGEGSYIEDSYIHDGAIIGKKCIISGVTLHNIKVPDYSVLHGLKLENGKYVARMYGINDNPKENKLFGRNIIEVTELKYDGPLWTAPIYPVCDTIEEAVNATVIGGTSDIYISLQDSFNQADVTAILPWQSKLDDMIRVESLLEAIDNRISTEEALGIFKNGISCRVKKLLLEECDKLDNLKLEEFSCKVRIYYYLSKLFTDSEKEELNNFCFNTIRDVTLQSAIKDIKHNQSYKIAESNVIVRLPVRVNWGGGWSDTPPYCMEHGGTVLNAAITLDGECPVEVVIKKIEDSKIILASTDNGSYKEFTEIRELV
jgi:fucokinase